MKIPDLSPNYFFPFYTVSEYGVKKYSHTKELVMHLSEKRGLLIVLNFQKGKLSNAKMKFINYPQFLYSHRDKKNIAYKEFAADVRVFYKTLQKALFSLNKEKPYFKKLFFHSFFKFSKHFELEFGSSEIEINFGDFDYHIENGKQVKKEREKTGHEMLDKVSDVLKIVDNHTEFKDMSEAEFNDGLNYCLSNFESYVEAPKFLRKKEYEL